MNTESIRKTLEKVIESRDFSLRIEESECDPLVKSINVVLEETEKRSEKIDLQKISLKDQAAIRNVELEKSNQQLVLDKSEDETSSLSKSVFLANLSHE